MIDMRDNILKFLFKSLHMLFLHCSSAIGVVLSFILENKLNVAKHIPILNEYEHELNIALYTVLFSKVINLLKDYLDKYIVYIECYFYENKYDMEKERVDDVLEIKTLEDSNRLYLSIKYHGYYERLKNYYLEISFPTWIDLNDFSRTSLFILDEKEMEEGLSMSKIIIDLSKLNMEDSNYIDGSQNIPLYFIINGIEEMGCRELVEIKVKSKNKLKLYEFNSNKLKIFKDL
jgi:hypothetical protein